MYFMELGDYLVKAEKIRSVGLRRVNVALLAAYTISGLKEVLQVKCSEARLDAQVWVGGYNQHFRQLLDEESDFYKVKYDITFLLIDASAVLGDKIFFAYDLDEEGRKRFVEERVEEYESLALAFLKLAQGKLVISNINVPNYSPYGIAEGKTAYSLKDMAVDFNRMLKARFLNESRVYVYDFNGFSARIGSENLLDYKTYYLGDFRVGQNRLPDLGDELMGYVLPLASKNRKCIVLDLDNTLWGGIVGEDGFEGIRLGPTPPGNAYLEFQKLLLALHKRGIILAINSKNNQDDAMKVIREHPHMVLREENFAAFRINWSDKASNMREIAKEINIGLDSIVFIDDDPVNRELIRNTLPEVLVVDLPEDESLYSKVLMGLSCLDSLQITADDRERGRMYAQESQRSKEKANFNDAQSFLKSLKIVVELRNAEAFSVPRIAQLMSRTNQFNLTTKRYAEEDISKMMAQTDCTVLSASVRDRFGDYGVAAAAIVLRKSQDIYVIDSFLMSCRVIGRGVEKAVLSHLVSKAGKAGAKKLVGLFEPTQKNSVCAGFYTQNGFKKVAEGTFEFNLAQGRLDSADYITLAVVE